MLFKNNQGKPYSLEKMISGEKIEQSINALAKEISQNYKLVHLVIISKGANRFGLNLIMQITTNLTFDLLSVSSYGKKDTSSGKIKIGNLKLNIHNKNVIIVEDIIDTGLTIAAITSYLRNQKPANLAVCVLLDKNKRKEEIKIRQFNNLKIPDRFVVGWGIDYQERHRELNEICCIKFSN